MSAGAPTPGGWARLHGYWFGGGVSPDPDWIPGRLPTWFFGDPAEDARIRAEFVPWLTGLTDEVADAWRGTARGTLALLLLWDQIPRNAFRGTPRAFAHDDRGLALAHDLHARGLDAELAPIERFFAVLPFQHQEDEALQRRQHEAILSQQREAPEGHQPFYAIAADMAARHRDAIERFGRFPHRNEILGRVSTPGELAFLEDPKNHF